MSKYRDKVRRRAGLPPEPSPPRTRNRIENRQYLDPETPDTSKFTPEVEAHIQGYLEMMDPRPWTQGWSTHHVVRHGDGYPVLESHHGASGQGAAYIVNAMPAILAHIKELEAKVAVSGGDFCRESRAKGCNPCGCCSLCVSEAQDRIVFLDAENAKLREIVRPFGMAQVEHLHSYPDSELVRTSIGSFTLGDFRRAVKVQKGEA